MMAKEMLNATVLLLSHTPYHLDETSEPGSMVILKQ